jgi:hypothetical protein
VLKRGHRCAVNDVTFSPDGSSVASASDDFSAKIWSAEIGELLVDLTDRIGLRQPSAPGRMTRDTLPSASVLWLFEPMVTGRIIHDDALTAATALARGAALRHSLAEAEDALLYVAPLTGHSLALGQHQRMHDALTPLALESDNLLRRVTGGACVFAGEGITYAALALRSPAALMTCPPGKILNRNIRGVLQGLRGVRVATNYFGRDFLAFHVRPGVYVSWAQDAAGRVLLEFFLAVSRSFAAAATAGYPSREQPPFRGRAPTSIAEAYPALSVPASLADALATGHQKAFNVALQPATLGELIAAEFSLPDMRARVTDDELCWSDPVEEVIGFLSAGVALNAQGELVNVRLRGDFMCADIAIAAFEDRVRGATTDPEVGEAINAIFTDPRYMLEGIGDLGSVFAVVTQALARARAR